MYTPSTFYMKSAVIENHGTMEPNNLTKNRVLALWVTYLHTYIVNIIFFPGEINGYIQIGRFLKLVSLSQWHKTHVLVYYIICNMYVKSKRKRKKVLFKTKWIGIGCKRCKQNKKTVCVNEKKCPKTPNLVGWGDGNSKL